MEIPAQRAVATTVPREEITAVLQDPDTDPELYLRISGEGDDSSIIGMSWSRAELEQLLEQASGDQIVLTFDHDELAGALGDVEAHGLRQRAVVFTVVAAGALGAGAGIANAMPSGDEGGPVVTQVASPAADSRVTDVSSAAGYAAPASAADSMVTDASSAAGYTAASETSSADTLVSDAASGAGYAAPTPGAADSLRTDASLSGGYGPAPTTDSGSFFSVHTPSTTDGLLAGGILLAISGATFAARRSSGTVRPA